MSAHSSPASYSDSSSSPPLTSLTERHLMQHKKEQHREQTRARMMRYRNKLKEMPEDEREEALARARAARARYRERNRTALLDAARCKRHAAYAEKFGQEALEAKLERKRQRELEQQERPRRRGRVRPTKSGKTHAVDDAGRTFVVRPYQYESEPLEAIVDGLRARETEPSPAVFHDTGILPVGVHRGDLILELLVLEKKEDVHDRMGLDRKADSAFEIAVRGAFRAGARVRQVEVVWLQRLGSLRALPISTREHLDVGNEPEGGVSKAGQKENTRRKESALARALVVSMWAMARQRERLTRTEVDAPSSVHDNRSRDRRSKTSKWIFNAPGCVHDDRSVDGRPITSKGVERIFYHRPAAAIGMSGRS
ncbi:hypothetical protein C8R47DRAFT_1082754 [Mycena vitilis]|nr:hypothetical protein C8R47DRAFT_1082754 [Mycena vitilis]